MKRLWKIKKDSEAVSPVIATILMVAITVVLAAVLLVLVLNIGDDTVTPTGSLDYNAAGDGNITVTFLSQAVDPTDLEFQPDGLQDNGTWDTTQVQTGSIFEPNENQNFNNASGIYNLVYKPTGVAITSVTIP